VIPNRILEHRAQGGPGEHRAIRHRGIECQGEHGVERIPPCHGQREIESFVRLFECHRFAASQFPDGLDLVGQRLQAQRVALPIPGKNIDHVAVMRGAAPPTVGERSAARAIDGLGPRFDPITQLFEQVHLPPLDLAGGHRADIQ